MTITELDPVLRARLDALTTFADKIRLLDREGIARADIARILDKRYQHVRNVLERDRQTRSAKPEINAEAPVRLRVAADGSLSIPAELVRALGSAPGSALSAVVESGELKVLPLDTAIRKVQDYFAQIIPAEVVLSEELIADRRAEAARE